MMLDLLWIIGIYAAAAAFAHWLIRSRSGEERRQYVLVAGNHQMQLEGYVRAIQQFSRRSGTDIGITVVLEQSTDETRRIAELLARRDYGIECVPAGQASMAASPTDARGGMHGNALNAAAGPIIRVDLDRLEGVKKLPL
ncbi:hypothetical protein ACF3MZ_21435 [Paenibacillaceae bacterium WGS1546]|uniref:hypothetical protein n=1 Tax=Cohnella sp. WGS1546 TaxID=3366810 RepID=UPI00372D5173